MSFLFKAMCCDNHGFSIKKAEQSVDVRIVSDADFPKVLCVDHFAEQVAGGGLGGTDVFKGDCDFIFFRRGEFAQEFYDRAGSGFCHHRR